MNIEHKTQQILLGLECCYDDLTIKRARYLFESLKTQNNDKTILKQSLDILKSMKDYPLNSVIEELVESETNIEKLLSTLRVIDHLSYNPVANYMRLLLKKDSFSGEDIEIKTLLSMLDDLKAEKSLFFIENLKDLLQEANQIDYLKKILNLYNQVYGDPQISALDKAIEHYINLDDNLALLSFLSIATDIPIFENLKKIAQKFPEARAFEAFSKGQVQSKMWAIKELNQLTDVKTNTFLILCGWYGVFPYLLEEFLNDDVERVRSIDLDDESSQIADELNKKLKVDQWKFKSVSMDINDINYQDSSMNNETSFEMTNPRGRVWRESLNYDVIVNMSCEHLNSFDKWYSNIKPGQMILLQSNDFFDCEEHVNCVKSLEEFKKAAPMSECLYEGELTLEKYTRFMLIGRK